MPQRNVASNFTFEQQRVEINELAADFWTQKGVTDTAAGTYLLKDGSNAFTGGTLAVPNAFTINANSGAGTVTINANLQVQGTTTTLNSTTLEIADKNIVLAKGSADDGAADGAGITVDSATDRTFNFVNADQAFVSSIGIKAVGGFTGDLTGDLTGDVTGTASGNATIANNSDNRVITGGAGNALNGEANLKFDGSRLDIDSSAQNILQLNSTHSDGPNVPFQRSGTTLGNMGSAAAITSGTAADFAIGATTKLVIATGGNERLNIDVDGKLVYKCNKSSGYIAEFHQEHADNPGTILIDGPSDGNIRPSAIELAQAGSVKWGIGQVYASTASQAFHICSGAATEANSKLTITTDGKVGIGQNNPSQLLEINGASSPCVLVKDTTNNVISYLFADDTNAYVGSASDHPVVIQQNNGAALTISTSKSATFAGKITANATGTGLHLVSTSTESNLLLQNDARTWKIVNYDYGTGADNLGFHDGTGDRLIISHTSGNATFTGTVTALAFDGPTNIPRIDKSSAHTIVAGDAGHCITAAGTITLPANNVMTEGDVISIYNASGSAAISIAAGGCTMNHAGVGAVTTLSLANTGLATVWWIAAGTCVISGSGLS